MKKYSVGSLFAGVGGICCAFQQASCTITWANELDANACLTYKLNSNNKLIEGSVKDLSKENLDEIDILVAGFPCQPFSQAGHSKGFNDERGALFFDVVRLLEELQPQAFFLENVKRLTTHDNKKTFTTIRQALTKAGYSFIPFVLNAARYTNIPQGRERTYMVGFRGESNYFYKTPIKENNLDVAGCSLSKSFTIPAVESATKKITSFLDKSTVDKTDIYNDKNNKIHERIREKVVSQETVYQYRRYFVRENKSNVCPTLTANMGGGGHNVPIILSSGVPRRLTPKECFNLQGFPKDFELPEITRGQLYKQAGNSVVVPMVQKIAKEMIRVLDECN